MRIMEEIRQIQKGQMIPCDVLIGLYALIELHHAFKLNNTTTTNTSPSVVRWIL